MNGSKRQSGDAYASSGASPVKRPRPEEPASASRQQRPFPMGSVTQIELKDFMCHAHLKFETGPDINLITGANGSGKSSILQAGFIFGHLARNPYFDNVTRRHGYSWGSSGFCKWRRGGVIFYRFFLTKKGPLAFWEGALSSSKSPPKKSKGPFFEKMNR